MSIQEVAAAAEAKLHDAYVDACETADKALDPESDLGLPRWACDLLVSAYEVMLHRYDEEERRYYNQ